jgi:hypothetical protein
VLLWEREIKSAVRGRPWGSLRAPLQVAGASSRLSTSFHHHYPRRLSRTTRCSGIVIPTIILLIALIAGFIARLMWTGELHVYKKADPGSGPLPRPLILAAQVEPHSLDDEERAFKRCRHVDVEALFYGGNPVCCRCASVLEDGIDMELEPFEECAPPAPTHRMTLCHPPGGLHDGRG